jgi:outer membrane receptor for ferrienterochelin and colicin
MSRCFSVFGIVWMSLTLAQAQTGTLRGRITDKESLQPLTGVNIMVQGTGYGAASDSSGHYLIRDIPVGGYQLTFSYIGFQKKTIPDVFVKSGKTVFVNAELSTEVLQGLPVAVYAGYFDQSREEPVSSQSLNYEEIRRAPGAREDVSRMLQNLPGVNPTADDRNDLVIRGGSPTEVLFVVDHIEIPNPNHFGTQGATGGPVSMINTEFVENMTFLAGGFTSEYGNKASGAMDIRLREGNRYGYNGKLDLGFGGVGGYFEGPLGNGKGSFLVGIHRSFLDFMQKVLNYGGTPIYANTQGKIVYDLGKRNQLSFLWLGGDDRIHIGYETKADDFQIGLRDTVDYQDIDFKSRQFTAGINWRSFWSDNFYTHLNLSHNYNRFFTDVNSIGMSALNVHGDLNDRTKVSKADLYDNISTENISTIKVEANWQIESNSSLSFGGHYKFSQFDHDIRYLPVHPDRPDAFGQYPKPLSVQIRQDLTPKKGAYINFRHRILDRFVYNLGGRYDDFNLLRVRNFSPRFNIAFDATERLELHAGTGRYYQDPEFIFITSDPSNKRNLKDICCDHFIIGMNYLLTPGTRLTLEAFRKNYWDYPVSADSGYEMISMANTGADYGSNGYSEKLTGMGMGRVNGFEFMLQQKMSDRFYGLLSYSYSVIKNKALDQVDRNGAFDNRHVLNLVAGYRKNKNWEFSLKWRYAGGTPYTPFDRQASMASGEGMLDLTRINEERFPAYHRLDLRVDHRDYHKKGTVVEYMSIENVYDRKNIRGCYWNRAQGKTDFNYQSGFFFVGGFSFEF